MSPGAPGSFIKNSLNTEEWEPALSSSYFQKSMERIYV